MTDDETYDLCRRRAWLIQDTTWIEVVVPLLEEALMQAERNLLHTDPQNAPIIAGLQREYRVVAALLSAPGAALASARNLRRQLGRDERLPGDELDAG